MKKKIVSILVSTAIVFICSMGVMADDPVVKKPGDADTEIPVTASISTSANTGTASIVYSVEISWTAPTLSGTQTSDERSYEWDAENCRYVAGAVTDGTTPTTGLSSNVKINVTNKSNEDVVYSISRKTTTETGWTVTFDDTITLPTNSTIAAADEATDESGARKSMLAGSTNEDALKGAPVSAPEFTDTVTVSAVPHLDSAVNVTVATYTVTLNNPTTSSWT